MEIKRIEEAPEDIIAAYLECIVMPNGELMSCGKSLGFLPQFETMSGKSAVVDITAPTQTTIEIHVRGGVAYPPDELPKGIQLNIIDHDNQ